VTKLDNNNHSVFLLTYHLIMVVKYRRRVIDDTIALRIRKIGEAIGENYRITFLEYNHDQDHIHIVFKAHPNSELRNSLKFGTNFGRNIFGLKATVW